jgi:hypothetical protein
MTLIQSSERLVFLLPQVACKVDMMCSVHSRG